MFEVLPAIYGDKGRFLVDFYTYFRWLDDIADSPLYSQDWRLEFIDRQKRLIRGDRLDGQTSPMEEFYRQMPFDAISSNGQDLLKEQFFTLAHAMYKDTQHFGLIPRTRGEIRQNNIRLFLPYAETVSIVLNGHTVKPTTAFMDLLDHWNYLGGLLHLYKDLGEERIIKVGFTRKEVGAINEARDEEERKKRIVAIFNASRFRNEWRQALKGFENCCSSFDQLDMPSYQKVISYLYLKVREPLRLPSLFKRVEKSLCAQ